MNPIIKHLLQLIKIVIDYLLQAFDCPGDTPPTPQAKPPPDNGDNF